MADSVRMQTVDMTSTDLNGHLPYAVSPLSITASAPSRTAIAMSLTCKHKEKASPHQLYLLLVSDAHIPSLHVRGSSA